MQGNSDQQTSVSQDAPGDFRASNGEIVRRVDLERAAGTPGRYTRNDPSIAGYEGVELARAALAGDLAALDAFHELAGLALPGVTEYSEGYAVRLDARDKDRVSFQATNQGGCDDTHIDAVELIAWILSPGGRAALARRGVVVPVAVGEVSAGTLTPEGAVIAARNVGVDLTCGECAALFYTGHPSVPGQPPAHKLSCKTFDCKVPVSQPRGPRPDAVVPLLDEIQGAIRSEHLPRTVDRLNSALERMLEAMPEFEGGGGLVDQLGEEMACLRDAAREACRQAGVPWTSKFEQERWLRWLRGNKGLPAEGEP